MQDRLPGWVRMSAIAGVLGVVAAMAHADTTTTMTLGWRTDGTGSYPAAQPPLKWSVKENVLWSVPTPARSNATPVLVDGKVLICAEPSTLLCLDAATGKTLWQHDAVVEDQRTPEEKAKDAELQAKADALAREINVKQEEMRPIMRAAVKDPQNAKLKAEFTRAREHLNQLREEHRQLDRNRAQPQTHETNGFATPTPVTDGKMVYAVFGTGVVVAHQLADGQRRWSVEVDRPTEGWGHSASPLLIDGKLLVHINDMRALDPATGNTLWTTPARARWGSSVAARIGDVPVVITPSGSIIRVSDGKLLASGLSDLEYNAPVVKDGVVYFIQSRSRAYRLPSEPADAIKPKLLWETEIASDRYYSSPVLHNGLIYAVMQQGVLSVLDAKSGKRLYEKRLDLGPGTYYPSISAAGNHIFVSSDNGSTVVLKAGPAYAEVARNSLEAFRSSPVFDGRLLFVRSLGKMYCIGSATTAMN